MKTVPAVKVGNLYTFSCPFCARPIEADAQHAKTRCRHQFTLNITAKVAEFEVPNVRSKASRAVA